MIPLNSKTANPSLPGVFDVSPEEVLEKKAELTLIDVRRPDEFTGELGHISGAQLLTLDTLPQNLGDIPRDKPIVFICRSGGRSGQATAFALEKGFHEVFNLLGGMLAWNEKQLPVEEKNS